MPQNVFFVPDASESCYYRPYLKNRRKKLEIKIPQKYFKSAICSKWKYPVKIHWIFIFSCQWTLCTLLVWMRIVQCTVVTGGDKTPLAKLFDCYSLRLFDIFFIFDDQMVAPKFFFALFLSLSLLLKVENCSNFSFFGKFWHKKGFIGKIKERTRMPYSVLSFI